MKQNYTFQRTLSALLLLLASSLSWAYDFEAKNADGVTIYYNLINDGTEAEVTYSTNVWTASYFDEVNIPETVEYNGKTLSVKSIGESAFMRCSNLTSVTIPESVNSIGNDAFWNCNGLTSLISMIEEPFAVNEDVFTDRYNNDIYANVTLYCPNPEAYRTTEGWKNFKNIKGLDEIPTAIQSVNDNVKGGDAIYNLNGVRVDRPAKGIYIKNGKKVMMK